MPKLIIKNNGERKEYDIDDKTLQSILLLVEDRQDRIMSEIARGITDETYSGRHTFDIGDGFQLVVMAIKGKVTLSLSLQKINKTFIIARFTRENYDASVFRETLSSIYDDPKEYAFNLVLSKDYEVWTTSLFRRDYLKVFPKRLLDVGFFNSLLPEYLTPEREEKMLDHLWLLLSLNRDELSVTSGVLGSLVRKGYLEPLQYGTEQFYLPKTSDTALNKREKMAMAEVFELFNYKVNRVSKTYNYPRDLLLKKLGVSLEAGDT